MFFSWYAKNRHFKRGSNLSGQITPFLLIILAVLLIAAIATINIGRTSIDKTCSANGADAGSLAAASAWGGAFNKLAGLNWDLDFYYALTYAQYSDLYPEASHYIDDAILYVASAEAFLAASLLLMSVPPLICGIIWVNGIPAAISNGLAVYALWEASESILAFNLEIQAMKSITDTFHTEQGQRYCDAVDFMQTSYIDSRKTGLNYAFSNSCIANRLSNAPPSPTQSDQFSTWLATDPYQDSPPLYTGTYSWQDKIDQTHTVSSTLDLPNIENFRIQPTQGTYANITSVLDDMISTSDTIHTILIGLGIAVAALGPIIVFIESLVIFGLNFCLPFCAPAWAIACGVGEFTYGFMMSRMVVIMGIIAIVALIGGQFWINTLKGKNEKAYSYWSEMGAPNTAFPIGKACAGGQPSDSIKDYMIVKIDEVILPRWTTTCCVSQTHPGTSTGILSTNYPTVRSCSTSKFSGGDVGAFNGFDPDTETYDPNKTYDPSITDTN